jgi:hypothetical protein
MDFDRIGRAQERPHVAPPCGATCQQFQFVPAALADLQMLGDFGLDVRRGIAGKHFAETPFVTRRYSGNHDR